MITKKIKNNNNHNDYEVVIFIKWVNDDDDDVQTSGNILNRIIIDGCKWCLFQCCDEF